MGAAAPTPPLHNSIAVGLLVLILKPLIYGNYSSPFRRLKNKMAAIIFVYPRVATSSMRSKQCAVEDAQSTGDR